MSTQRRENTIIDIGRPTVWTIDLESMLDIVFDSVANGHVVMDPGYLSDVREIAFVEVELTNKTMATVTKIGIAKVGVRGKIVLERKAYCVPEIKLILISGTRLDEYGITYMFKLGCSDCWTEKMAIG